QGRAAAGGLWVEGDHAVYCVISSSRNASSNSYRTPRVLSPGEQIKRVKAMRVNSGARVELATGDIDVSKCRINDGSWRNSNDRGHTATVNVAAWYRRAEALFPQLSATAGVEGINAIVLSCHVHDIVAYTIHCQCRDK